MFKMWIRTGDGKVIFNKTFDNVEIFEREDEHHFGGNNSSDLKRWAKDKTIIKFEQIASFRSLKIEFWYEFPFLCKIFSTTIIQFAMLSRTNFFLPSFCIILIIDYFSNKGFVRLVSFICITYPLYLHWSISCSYNLWPEWLNNSKEIFIKL